MTDKTHYRKAFDSPYLSSADIVEPTTLTIRCVKLELDRTKKTKDHFNTAYFVENEIRKGEVLKPMILNATNSKTIKKIANSPFIDDWNNLKVTVYVDHNVKFGRETLEGLRISHIVPDDRKKELTPGWTKGWSNAVAAYVRDGHLKTVLEKVDISQENQLLIIEHAEALKVGAQ